MYLVIPIRPHTAKRLGLRKPLSAKVIKFAGALGYTLEPWQERWLIAYYRSQHHG